MQLRHHKTLTAPRRRPHLASVSVGPLGEAIAIWTDLAGLAAVGADGEVWEPQPHGTPRDPVSSTVTVQTQGRLDLLEIAELTAFPKAQPLPDGRVLVVGARAEWRPEGPEENATIYGPDGSPQLTACVGDGISHVRTTPGGAVWLGYFDEGVYGNLGWGRDGSPEPIGWPGLLRTTPELAIDWRYPGDELDPIGDCEALNLEGEVAWASTDLNLSVIRVEDSQVRSWPTKADGATALVVDGERAALMGGYDDDRDRLLLGHLDKGFTRPRKTRVAMPDGSRLPAGAVMLGRGDELHVFVGSDWFRMSLEDMG
jgi:hypothetical protein